MFFILSLFISLIRSDDDCCGANPIIVPFVRGCTFNQICQQYGHGHCKPTMVTSYNLPHLVKLLVERRIESAGVGGWNGEVIPMVLRADGNLNPYDPLTNPTCHVMCERIKYSCEKPTPIQSCKPEKCHHRSKEYCMDEEKKPSTCCGFIEKLFTEDPCTIWAIILFLFICKKKDGANGNNQQETVKLFEKLCTSHNFGGEGENSISKGIYLLNLLCDSQIVSGAVSSGESDCPVSTDEVKK